MTNGLPVTVDLHAYRGDTWTQKFRLLQADTPIDLTTATIESEARAIDGTTHPLTVTITDPDTGELEIALPEGSIPPARYHYDIEITDTGTITTWIQGTLTVDRDVTNELP